MDSNTSRPLPSANTGSALLNALSDLSFKLVQLERRFDPLVRPAFDALLRDPIAGAVTALINWQRTDDGLKLAEERPLPGEEQFLDSIISTFQKQMSGLWKPGGFERGGNTKTHGIVRGEFIVHEGLPEHFRHGIFAEPRSYRAWVRFSGPGPYITPDIDDVGFMSISIKLMGVPGVKLMSEEQFTQDMFGVSTPTFVTPDVRANAQLQLESLKNASILYFVNLRRSHLLDLIMQSLWVKTQSSPFEAPYFSCVPYLLGEGQAMQYSVWPISKKHTHIPRLPFRPPCQLSSQRNGGGARRRRRRARFSYPDANRPLLDACRECGSALADETVASRVGRDLAPAAPALRLRGANQLRETSILQSLALHSRAPAARQSEPRAAPDVFGAVHVSTRHECDTSLRADGR